MPLVVDVLETTEVPAYQRLAAQAADLRKLGMSFESIGRALGVSHVTAAKAARWAG